jgi:hypothetical protein
MKIGINNSIGIAGPSAAVPSDPFFDNVVLLVNAEDGLVDKSKYARTLTPIANTQTSVGWAAQGEQSITYDVAGDSLSYDANVAELDLNTQDFTIECTVRWRVDPATSVQCPMSVYRANTNDRSWFIQYAGSVPDLRAFVHSAGTSTPSFGVIDTTFDPVIDTDYAIAFVRSGDDLILFVNGVEKARTAMTADFDVWTSDQLGYLSGLISPSSLTQVLANAYMDEIRITVGVARYTADYEVATTPFPEQ